MTGEIQRGDLKDIYFHGLLLPGTTAADVLSNNLSTKANIGRLGARSLSSATPLQPGVTSLRKSTILRLDKLLRDFCQRRCLRIRAIIGLSVRCSGEVLCKTVKISTLFAVSSRKETIGNSNSPYQ